MQLNKLAALIGSGALLVSVGCKKSDESATGPAGATTPGQPVGAAAPSRQKLSQFDKARFCDIAAGPNGALHAVFTDQPDSFKPSYLYYRTSTDGGATWSEAKNLSDDESGNAAGYARVAADGKGRVYVVWKYIGKNEILDGPGGYAAGKIVYRCLENGAWSPRALIGDDKIPSFSWFAAVDPNGGMNVVWSQITQDALPDPNARYWYHSNFIRQATLDGGKVADVKNILTPKPLVTEAEQKAMQAAGKNVTYEEMHARFDGLINLRGYVDASGAPHFVAEDKGVSEGPSDQQTGNRIMLWDGGKLTSIYAFERYQTYNNFNNPPVLLTDAQGKQYMVRSPEKSEKAAIRVYPIENGAMGDFVEPIAAKSGKGSIFNWQAYQLPGGKMAVLAALSEKGGAEPDDTELFLSTFENGKWSESRKVTNVSTQGTFNHKETGGGNAVSSSVTYDPRFASITAGKDGRLGMLMVLNESTLIGITNAGVTSSGRAVSALSTGRVDSPQVVFQKP